MIQHPEVLPAETSTPNVNFRPRFSKYRNVGPRSRDKDEKLEFGMTEKYSENNLLAYRVGRGDKRHALELRSASNNNSNNNNDYRYKKTSGDKRNKKKAELETPVYTSRVKIQVPPVEI